MKCLDPLDFEKSDKIPSVMDVTEMDKLFRLTEHMMKTL